jgi:D-alanyl-D-alanine carboxypeptidase
MISAVLMLQSGTAFAGASLVFDVQTGAVLEQDNAFQRWYPASLTKLMTAYIAFSAIKSGRLTLESPVKISANAAKQPPSKMGYKPGNQLTLDNALKIMLVKSANDIAVAVGETAGGTNYPDAMNAAAAKLGMTGSHFVNANGLHSAEHYTTARDLAVLARALRTEFPDLSSYFRVEAIKYGDHLERNYNILLGRFAGADGMKTGFVCASGFNLVGSATRNGRTLVAVILGEKSQVGRAEKAADLLASGFAAPSGFGSTLDTLKQTGGQAKPAIDMRDTVCSKQAEADRWDGREIEGKVVFNTANLHAMERDPVTVAVGLLPTTAADGWPLNVPVPKPRPEYPPASIAAPLQDAELRPAIPATVKKKKTK